MKIKLDASPRRMERLVSLLILRIMIKQRKILTIEEHLFIAETLKKIISELCPIATEIPLTHKVFPRVKKQACMALDAIERLRCALDDQMLNDFPRAEYEGIYYGANA